MTFPSQKGKGLQKWAWVAETTGTRVNPHKAKKKKGMAHLNPIYHETQLARRLKTRFHTKQTYATASPIPKTHFYYLTA
jgi:hypothetical protein